MYYVGIDIGSTASKTVVTGDKEIKFVLPTGWKRELTNRQVFFLKTKRKRWRLPMMG